jgi:hypothetical protein
MTQNIPLLQPHRFTTSWLDLPYSVALLASVALVLANMTPVQAQSSSPLHRGDRKDLL